jgi:hypothetical protein
LLSIYAATFPGAFMIAHLDLRALCGLGLLFLCACTRPPETAAQQDFFPAPDLISERLPRGFLLLANCANAGVLRFEGERSQIVIALDHGKLVLVERLDGRDQRREVSVGPTTHLSVAKTDDFIEIFLDRAHVMSATSSHQRWLSAHGDGLQDARVQKTGSIVFADDFMRAVDAPSLWQAVRGEWTPQGVDNAVRSANPFSFLAKGDDALALSGQPFWRDYAMQCSLRPEGASMFGLLVNARDAEHHYRVAWQAGKLSLDKVSAGEVVELASKELPLVDKRWYRLRVQTLRGLILVDLDEQRQLAAYDSDYWLAGGVGLAASTDEEGGVTWDDIHVTSVEGFAYDFTNAAEKDAVTHLGASDRRTVHGFRRRNSFVGATASGDCELRNRWYDDANFAFLRRSGDKLLLGLRDRGQETVLAEQELAAGARALRLIARDEMLAGSVDGQVRMVGRVRVEAAGLCQVLGEVSALSAGAEDGPASLNRVHPAFSHERSMSYWSHPGNDWKQSASEFGPLFWHRGDFWAGLRLGVDLNRLRAEQGSAIGIGLVLAPADRAAFADFARFVIDGTESRLVLNRYIGEHLQESLALGPADAVQHLAIERLGQTLVLTANGDLRWHGALPPTLHGLANLAIEGIAPDTLKRSSTLKHKVDSAPEPPKWLEALSVAADHVHTESFHDAPVDWHIGAGTWEVTNRWQCDPRWHFFAGYNLEGASCLWFKRPHGDNITLEFFAAPKMDRARGGKYEYAADLNAVICADGQDVSSGYSFLFGGKDNTGSFVKRGTKPIISNEEITIPRSSSIHHRWFYIKLRKAGNRISYWVDGDLVGEYEESDSPLPGGFLGLWTWRNAIMVSQVRIASDGLHPDRGFVYGDAEPAVPYMATAE